MKALTVLQPWAWAIIHGSKRIENRSWQTHHRGPLIIHAGASDRMLGQYGPGEPPRRELVFAAILGVVDVVGCVPLVSVEGEPFAEGPWCWLLDNPRPLEKPIPYRGAQLLWDVPDELIESLIS